MEGQRFRLGLGNGAYGHGDTGEIILPDGGIVRGPNLPNWQGEYLLGICETPTSYRGDAVRYVTISPRYAGESLDDIRQSGGEVGVGRVLPGRNPQMSRAFKVDDVEYWAVGALSRLES
jgi:hypothetical protein